MIKADSLLQERYAWCQEHIVASTGLAQMAYWAELDGLMGYGAASWVNQDPELLNRWLRGKQIRDALELPAKTIRATPSKFVRSGARHRKWHGIAPAAHRIALQPTIKPEMSYAEAAALAACHYCGVVADTVDHVTPHTIKAMIGFEHPNPVTARTETVMACRECNSALGGRFYQTLADRKVAAKDHIRRKYEKYLRIPHWTDQELATLSHELQAYVRRGLIIQKLTRMRLAW